MITILDLGCGTGNELLPHYKKGNAVIGVDIDEENIATCKKQMPNGTFFVGDITSVDLSKFTDITNIICTEVIEHVSDWKQLIKNISTIPGSPTLLLTTPYIASEKKLLAIRSTYWEEIGHRHFFSGEELVQELASYGWTNIRTYRWNASLYFELKSLFKRNAPCIRNTYYQQILPLPLLLFYQLFRTNLFQTRLKYLFPIWMITLPIGKMLDTFWGAGIHITAHK